MRYIIIYTTWIRRFYPESDQHTKRRIKDVLVIYLCFFIAVITHQYTNPGISPTANGMYTPA